MSPLLEGNLLWDAGFLVASLDEGAWAVSESDGDDAVLSVPGGRGSVAGRAGGRRDAPLEGFEGEVKEVVLPEEFVEAFGAADALAGLDDGHGARLAGLGAAAARAEVFLAEALAVTALEAPALAGVGGHGQSLSKRLRYCGWVRMVSWVARE